MKTKIDELKEVFAIAAESQRIGEQTAASEIARLRALEKAVRGLPEMIRQAVRHLEHAKVGGTVCLESYARAIEEALRKET